VSRRSTLPAPSRFSQVRHTTPVVSLLATKSPETNVVHDCSVNIVKARENDEALRLSFGECFVATHTRMKMRSVRRLSLPQENCEETWVETTPETNDSLLKVVSRRLKRVDMLLQM